MKKNVMVLLLDNITNDEVFYFRKGDTSLDLTYVNDIIFFLLKIDGIISLVDTPFPICSSVKDFQKLRLLIEKYSAIQFFLVETSNNTIKAMRIVGISEEFLKLLGKFIEKQMEKQITAVDYHKGLNYIYKLLSPYDLKKMSTISYKISGYSEKFQK